MVKKLQQTNKWTGKDKRTDRHQGRVLELELCSKEIILPIHSKPHRSRATQNPRKVMFSDKLLYHCVQSRPLVLLLVEFYPKVYL